MKTLAVVCGQSTSLRGSMAIATMTANSPFPPGGFGHAYPGSDNDLRVEKALQADNVDNPCLRIVTFWPRKSCPYGCQSPHVNRAQTVSREEALAQLNDFVTQNGRSPMAADDGSCGPGPMPGLNTAPGPMFACDSPLKAGESRVGLKVPEGKHRIQVGVSLADGWMLSGRERGGGCGGSVPS